MSPRQYVTPASFAAWAAPEVLPVPSAREILAATLAVESYLVAARYDSNPLTGLPTDGDITASIQAAVCEQIVYGQQLKALGPAAALGTVTSASVGSASWSFGREGRGTARTTSLCPAAIALLRTIPREVTTYG